MQDKPVIVLFDHDLRLHDNPALVAAAKTGKPLIFLYVHGSGRPLGRGQMWWLSHSLKALQKKIPLTIRKGSLKEVVRTIDADALFANECYDPARTLRLKKLPIVTEILPGNLLVHPEEIKPYKVFTPFWRQCLKQLDVPKPLPIPRFKLGPKLKSETLGANIDFSNAWTPGEDQARKTLKSFVAKGLSTYHMLRDRPDFEGTSRLSPHIRWGEISVREIYHAVKSKKGLGPTTFLSEIGFREFSYHLLHHFPRLASENFNPKFDKFKWEGTPAQLKKWKEGKTGFPIIDAGMRQLKETGWMHNRIRMLVGSFLTKDLLIDWRKGETHFWDLLVDGDPALNAFNWQWVAGTGADAAPYFRIFNPWTQQKKFDPNGDYIHDWIPELDEDYIEPIVDHDERRKEALALYGKIK